MQSGFFRIADETRSAARGVWVATTPVDMRKSFDSLAEVVRAFLGHDPLCGHLFVFRNRSAERVKILWWDKTCAFGGQHPLRVRYGWSVAADGRDQE